MAIRLSFSAARPASTRSPMRRPGIFHPRCSLDLEAECVKEDGMTFKNIGSARALGALAAACGVAPSFLRTWDPAYVAFRDVAVQRRALVLRPELHPNSGLRAVSPRSSQGTARRLESLSRLRTRKFVVSLCLRPVRFPPTRAHASRGDNARFLVNCRCPVCSA
jgi:hypothetical protein